MTWIPDAYTLPTGDRPPRAAAFDALFADALVGAGRLGATRARLVFAAAAEARVRDLVTRGPACPAPFRFTVQEPALGRVAVEVAVPEEYAADLDALVVRATTAAGTRLAAPAPLPRSSPPRAPGSRDPELP
ncbi:hypothetical protein [Yinghuangia sp. YIM S09857]|uniref:hypothetical protein n=1 Tax=Yinghuangia sp. YIM S09857 TaxID=3436929 RepID=UPI003F53A895